jgi:hypothetical protein
MLGYRVCRRKSDKEKEKQKKKHISKERWERRGKR